MSYAYDNRAVAVPGQHRCPIGKNACMPPTPSLDRQTIVDAAIRILATDGPDGLSMRRLAADLDTKPMTLYHYVPNKSALLSMALSDVAANIPWTPPTGTPTQRMAGIVMDMYERLGELPWVVSILTTGTNVGVPALALAEQFLDATSELGLDDQRSLDLWRACWYLVQSELGWQETLARRKPGETSWHERLTPDDLIGLPRVAGLLGSWPNLSRAFDLREAVQAQTMAGISER